MSFLKCDINHKRKVNTSIKYRKELRMTFYDHFHDLEVKPEKFE